MTSAAISSRVAGFPFPLARDAYRYSANLEPAPTRHDTEAGSWGAAIMNAGPDYEDFIAERAAVLARHPGILITAPHMRPAEWDAFRYVMRRLAAEYPAGFTLAEDGPRWQWANHRLGIRQDLVLGDDASLPCGPLEYAGRQVVEDLVLLDARDGHLHADADLVLFASGWSFPFVAGMSFAEIHGPVPRANADGVFTRAERSCCACSRARPTAGSTGRCRPAGRWTSRWTTTGSGWPRPSASSRPPPARTSAAW